jgi:hypothetical protein
MRKFGRFAMAIVTLSLAARLSGGPLAEEPAAKTERFTGTIMVLNAPVTGMAQVKITVERFTTDEERKKLAEALRAGGTDALVRAMGDMEAGYIQIENNLRWPIRTAASWQTDKGRKVRFATDRPMYYGETQKNTRSVDYPIGFIEILLPPEGKGEGMLYAATQAQFDANGRLEVRSLPSSTGPQKITNVVSEIVQPKKSKKK